MKIALDAMGSDGAPEVEVRGAIQAAKRLGPETGIILVGNQEVIRNCLRREGSCPANIEVVQASETISMDDPPIPSLKRKRDASIPRALNLVAEGEAEAVVSAGNTGAVVGAARLALKTLPLVERPAIAATLPSVRDSFTLIDAGANTDCRPEHLLQFAQMGVEYSRFTTGKRSPRVGLLNIGEEFGKGNELARGAHRLLRESNLNFVGNVEGGEVFMGQVDVIVSDGFAGNIFLKAAEGVSAALQHILVASVRRNFFRTALELLIKPALAGMWRRADFEEYGGAPLLGVNGICIISHGRSTPKAIASALELAGRFGIQQMNQIIASAVSTTDM